MLWSGHCRMVDRKDRLVWMTDAVRLRTCRLPNSHRPPSPPQSNAAGDRTAEGGQSLPLNVDDVVVDGGRPVTRCRPPMAAGGLCVSSLADHAL
jgi:hypothetical protein